MTEEKKPAHNPDKDLAIRQKPLIKSIVIGLFLFLFLFTLSEILFRNTRIDQILSWRSVGIYHGQFEIKWFKLNDYSKNNNGVDVLLLGNSIVNTGINPEILSAEYQALTGESLRIFNFGIEGLTVAPNSVIAKILASVYHPDTIIFLTEMRDYAAENGLEVEEQLLSEEWMVAQQGGKETTRVWLTDNLLTIPHLLPFRNWSRADFPDSFLMQARRFHDTSSTGYEPDQNVGIGIDIPPSPNNPDETENFALLKDFSVDPCRLANLQEILDLNTVGIQVIITEMPVHPTYFTYYGNDQAHEEFLTELVPFIIENNGIYLAPPAWQEIPLTGRVDHHHLNDSGATVFSKLLAKNLADLCLINIACLATDEAVVSLP